ncbi:MAG: alpha/beta hydrolase [Myxococcota bacterium]
MPEIEANGQSLHVQDSGGDGPPIVFLHGFLMDGDMFDPQVAVLSPSCRCIRIDSRASGRTVWDGQPFSLYDTVSDVVAVLDALEIDAAVVVGMSMGGYTALRLALRHPERLRGVVLIGTRHSADPEAVHGQYIEAREVWKAHGAVDQLAQGLMTAIIGPQDQNAALWDTWMPKWKQYPGASYAAATNALLERDDLPDDAIRGITLPALVVHGVEDLGVPLASGEALAALLPGCETIVRVAGASHSVNLTHPEAVNPPLQAFLASLD